MKKRTLGRSGIEIAPLVFGGNVFGWTVDQARSFELLDRFVERGFNAIDTADMYASWAPGLSGGESETVIGQWLARSGRRDEIVLMTKIGLLEQHKGLSAANIEVAVENSLKRLGTDHIDVLFAHIDDAQVPLEETLSAFNRLVKAGKVRTLGASNYSAERFQLALDVSREQGLARYEVMQPRYNLHDRQDFESGLAALAQESEIGVVSFFALASGFLTGKYRSIDDIQGNARADFLASYFTERGERVLQELLSVADELSARPAQVALAWLLTRPALTAPIASATSLTQLDELLDAVTLPLPEPLLARLNEASRGSV
ncbi:MAG: aldo/keto reductase [Gammaproteobacteria bacterium]|nr:aldo/keto reductase [Gammaproteobacteria bacterium]